MDRILLVVAPASASDSARLVDQASDLVEAMTASVGAGVRPVAALGVVADVSSCVAVGAAVLGRGTEDAPALRLFPFRHPAASASVDAVDERDALDALDALRELQVEGAVALPEAAVDAGQDALPDASTAVGRALAGAEWQAIVALGDAGEVRVVIDAWAAYWQRPVIRPGDSDVDARAPDDVEPGYAEERYLAARDATQLAALIDALHLDD